MENANVFTTVICILVMIMGFAGYWENAQTVLLFCIFGQLVIIKEILKK